MKTFSKLRGLGAGVAIFCLLGSASVADLFQVKLGGRTLGSVSYEHNSGGQAIEMVLNHTPLGAADGTFEGTSKQVRTDAGEVLLQYLGKSDSRQVSILMDDGRTKETTINPRSDLTALSNPSEVPSPVFDPVATFGRFVSAEGCPRAFRMYDGRRVAAITPAGSGQGGDRLECQMTYRVIAGPGHMSLLNISSISVGLSYDTSARQQRLMAMQLGIGAFNLDLQR